MNCWKLINEKWLYQGIVTTLPELTEGADYVIEYEPNVMYRYNTEGLIRIGIANA